MLVLNEYEKYNAERDAYRELYNQYVDLCEISRENGLGYCFDWRIEIPEEKHALFLEISAKFDAIWGKLAEIEKRNNWVEQWVCKEDGGVCWRTNSRHPEGAGWSCFYHGEE